VPAISGAQQNVSARGGQAWIVRGEWATREHRLPAISERSRRNRGGPNETALDAAAGVADRDSL